MVPISQNKYQIGYILIWTSFFIFPAELEGESGEIISPPTLVQSCFAYLTHPEKENNKSISQLAFQREKAWKKSPIMSNLLYDSIWEGKRVVKG